MAEGQNQMDTIFSKIAKCMEHLKSIDGPEKLTEKSFKDKKVLKPLNGYIGIKDDLRTCLEFLKGQFGPGTQVDDTQREVAHCLKVIRVMTVPKSVTGEMLKNKKLREELNGYIDIKERLVECFYFLQEQTDAMLPDAETHKDMDKIQSVRPENDALQNKICIAKTAKPRTTGVLVDFKKLIQNRLEVEQLKERLAKSTKLVLIDELVEPVKKNLKSFKEKDLIDLLVQRNADLMDRLAAEMNEKLSRDESDLENISIQNRPMNVAEEYNLLMSNAWLEAKCSLDAEMGEDKKEAEKYQLLCEIITESRACAQVEFESAMKRLGKRLKDPLEQRGMSADTKHTSETEKKAATHLKCTTMDLARDVLPHNVQCCIGDYFRVRADEVNLEALVREIQKACIGKAAEGKQILERLFGKAEVLNFVKECARLSWKMVIQRPPMCFENMDLVDKPWKGDDKLELVWGSDPKNKGAVVKYYKHPVLLHGEQVMVKGAVFVE